VTEASTQTSPSTRPLSEIARHVVYPSGIVATGWTSVDSVLREMGILFDAWQVAVAKLILAKRANGMYAAGIGGIIMSICRQAGKTYMLGGIIFALCRLFPGTTVIWTAHQLRTANETFRSMQGFARREHIKRYVEKVTRGAGDEGIYFTNGSRILFGARERGFGLGFAKVDILVIDEAQRVTERAVDDMVPSTNQAANPLILMIGTPPRPSDPGERFAARRKEAIDGTSEDTLYIEFSADPDTDPLTWGQHTDWAQVAKANPSYPHRTPKAAIMRMMKNLGMTSFRREGLGIWDMRTHDAPFPIALWRECQIESPPVSGSVAYGVKFSTDGQRVALAASMRPAEGPVFVEAISVTPSANVDELVTWLVARSSACDAIVIDGKSGAGDLLSRLRQAGVPMRRLISPTVDEVITAHSGFATALASGDISHSGQAGLDASVAVAGRRKIGNHGGWGIEPIEADGDVLALESVIFARFGVVTQRIKHHVDRTAGTGRRAVVL